MASKEKPFGKRRTKPYEEYKSPFRKPFKDTLLSGIVDINKRRALKGEPPLTRGEYMREAFPGRYNDEASADRAFRKIRAGQTSGRNLERYSLEVGPEGARHVYYFDEEGTVNKKETLDRSPFPPTRARRMCGSETGYWKVNVTFLYPGDDGEPDYDYQSMEEHTKSFVVLSEDHQDFANRAYIEDMVQGVIEEKVVEWQRNKEYAEHSVEPGFIATLVEVFPVQGTTLPNQQREFSMFGHPDHQAVVLEDLEI